MLTRNCARSKMLHQCQLRPKTQYCQPYANCKCLTYRPWRLSISYSSCNRNCVSLRPKPLPLRSPWSMNPKSNLSVAYSGIVTAPRVAEQGTSEEAIAILSKAKKCGLECLEFKGLQLIQLGFMSTCRFGQASADGVLKRLKFLVIFAI